MICVYDEATTALETFMTSCVGNNVTCNNQSRNVSNNAEFDVEL